MGSILEEGSKKFLEGWTSQKSESAKNWKKCWTVLKGTFIFLFSSDKTTKENVVDSLSLGFGTSVFDMKNKKEFKFELTTRSNDGQTKKNLFKFSKESDFNLWKAYIVAITTGSIPTDARLLPGQQSDVYEAMIEVRKQGQPLSSPVRGQTPAPPPPSQNLSNGRLNNVPEQFEAGDEDDPVVKQLKKRQEELAEKEIHDPHLTLSVSSGPILELMDTLGGTRQMGSGSSSSRSVASQEATASLARSHTSPTISATQKRASYLYSNHSFYADASRNHNGPPSWFVNCSRDQAEEILTIATKFGTVLMRASSGYPLNGNYVISFRRELRNKVVVSHYNIIRTEEGFKIDVENKHSPMTSLSVVMEFFLTVAGKTAKPLTSNDLTQLLGKYQAAAFPTVVEEDSTSRRSSITSSITSVGLPSFSSQPTMPSGSNRSSSISIGSQNSRNSRGSFDLTNRRTSDPHVHHQMHFPTDDRRSSAASSVFYDGHGSARAGSEGSGSYRGSITESINYDGGSLSPTKFYSSGSRPSLNGSASPPNDSQIYSNQSETVASEDPVSGGSRLRSTAEQYGADTINSSGSGLRSPRGSVLPSDSTSDSQSRRGFDTQSSNSSKPQWQSGPYSVVGGRSQTGGTMTSVVHAMQNSPNQQPPPPPPKPGPHEIYLLMKPLPSNEGEYSPGSDFCGTLGTSEGNSIQPTKNVKELARMLQCSLEK